MFPPEPTPTQSLETRVSRPSRRGLIVLVALAAVLAFLVASCKQLDPSNRAAPVPGVTNGNIPISYLASTTSGCKVYDEALNSLKAMIAQAAKDGVTLRPESCYRDYAGQVAARDEWCGRGACQMAAVPGTSNHGWGKAVDFADETGELDFDSAGYTWMTTWAGHFGWIHPKGMEADGPVPEAWHWEWIGDGGKMFLGEYFGIGNAPLAEPRGLPYGSVDNIQAVEGGVSVYGWAIDPDQVASIPVHIYVDAASIEVMANVKRPDVNAAFPLYAGAQHGYSAYLTAPPGQHTVCVYAINVSGTGFNRKLGCATVTVAPPVTTTTVAPSARTTVVPAPTTTTTGAPAPAPAPTTTTTAVPATTTTVAPATTTTTARTQASIPTTR